MRFVLFPGTVARWSGKGVLVVCVVRLALRSEAEAPPPPPLSLRLGREGMGALDEIARRRRVTRSEAAR